MNAECGCKASWDGVRWVAGGRPCLCGMGVSAFFITAFALPPGKMGTEHVD
jgi:hypothetical protein